MALCFDFEKSMWVASLEKPDKLNMTSHLLYRYSSWDGSRSVTTAPIATSLDVVHLISVDAKSL